MSIPYQPPPSGHPVNLRQDSSAPPPSKALFGDQPFRKNRCAFLFIRKIYETACGVLFRTRILEKRYRHFWVGFGAKNREHTTPMPDQQINTRGDREGRRVAGGRGWAKGGPNLGRYKTQRDGGRALETGVCGILLIKLNLFIKLKDRRLAGLRGGKKSGMPVQLTAP